MKDFKIEPRIYQECPYYIDAQIERKISGSANPLQCERRPVNMFHDRKCVGCPLLLDHCEYYGKHERTAVFYPFCPICGRNFETGVLRA